MKNLNIGISFSGGGYRAATFHLGTLSFLHSIKVSNGKTLLECISVMSTVSGGTITGLKYMLALAKKQDVNAMVKELFDFLYHEDLVGDAFANLEKRRTEHGASLIKVMAGIYDDRLFNLSVMGDLMACINDIPVKHFSANATDFDNGLPFRFQVTAGLSADDAKSAYGVFGNNKHRLKRDVAQQVSLGEALACSSCFPSGFEPMMFPDDFKGCANKIEGKGNRFGIMDGGVVDNQGIEPILLAEERMRRCDKERTDKTLDLIIVSDVASSEMDGYTPCQPMLPQCIGGWTIAKLQRYALFTEIAFTLLLMIAIVGHNPYIIGGMAVVWGMVTLANVALRWMNKKVVGWVSGTIIGQHASMMNHLSFADIESLLMNRAKSVIMMSSTVFLKRIRKLSYETLYNDPDWRNRMITNTIYELRTDEKWASRMKNGTIPEYLKPSEAMQKNSYQAANMGTTLWFMDEDKAMGVPEAILAAGQYTICYNLLDYIYKIRNQQDNLNENHQLIMDCEQQLLEAWKQFQKDPQWMVPPVKG